MAQLIINLPDEKIEIILDALGKHFNYQEKEFLLTDPPQVKINPETRNEFVLNKLREFIVKIAIEQESKDEYAKILERKSGEYK